MKKVFLSVFAVIALSFLSQAQFKVGLKAGGQSSSIKVSGESSFFSNDNYRNFHVGLVGEQNITENLYLQSHLLYVRKGTTLEGSTELSSTKLRMNNIEMSTMVLFKHPVEFGKLFIGVGGALNYGINGYAEQDGQKRKLYSDIKTWRREDISLNFTAGLELKNGLFVSATSQKGLSDMYKGSATVRSSGYAVSVGYLIDWKLAKRKNQ